MHTSQQLQGREGAHRRQTRRHRPSAHGPAAGKPGVRKCTDGLPDDAAKSCRRVSCSCGPAHTRLNRYKHTQVQEARVDARCKRAPMLTSVVQNGAHRIGIDQDLDAGGVADGGPRQEGERLVPVAVVGVSHLRTCTVQSAIQSAGWEQAARCTRLCTGRACDMSGSPPGSSTQWMSGALSD